MMKRNLSMFIGWRYLILTLVVVLYGLPESAYCEDTASQPFEGWRSPADSTVLLLQQTDPGAGTVTPGVGVHYFGLHSEVTLTAAPQLGYRFLYWIGDVSDPVAQSTLLYLDTPKIVIAVFERSEFEFLPEEVLQNTLGRGGGMRRKAADYSRQGGGGGGGKGRGEFRPPRQPQPAEPIPEEALPAAFPVPHMPEPATVLLLGLGSLLSLRFVKNDRITR